GAVSHPMLTSLAIISLVAVGLTGRHKPERAKGLPLPWRRWILAYTGGLKRPQYSALQFEQLLSVVDTAGKPIARAYDGVTLLELTRHGDRGFTPLMKPPAASG